MNEATIVRKMITEIKSRIPSAVIFKHADAVTAGIPDVSVTYNGRVLWVEVKYLRVNETVYTARRKFDKRQLTQCLRLEAQQACRYFVAYQGRAGLVATALKPSEVQWSIASDDVKGHWMPFYEAITELLQGGEHVLGLRQGRYEAQADQGSSAKQSVLMRRGSASASRKVQTQGVGANPR